MLGSLPTAVVLAAAVTAGRASPVTAPAPAAASVRADDPLAKARQAYTELDLDTALAELDRASKKPLERETLIELYELTGLTNTALNRSKRAKEAYLQILMLAPDYKLPAYVGPRMAVPLSEARASLALTGPLRATQKAPAKVTAAAPVTIELRLENDPLGMANKFRIDYRLAGRRELRQKTVPASATALVGLELTDVVTTQLPLTVDYWCTLLDNRDHVLMHLGTSNAPFTITIAAPLPQPPTATASSAAAAPWWTRWWVWTAAGVVATGVTVGVMLSLQPESPACPPGVICGALRER